MSVNLSGRQFAQPDLVEEVAGILAESGLAPAALELEITESVVMDQSEAGVRTLRRLRDLGVRLVLDDFGTGYSSLSYLKHLPLDTIKIDRSFVAGLEEVTPTARSSRRSWRSRTACASASWPRASRPRSSAAGSSISAAGSGRATCSRRPSRQRTRARLLRPRPSATVRPAATATGAGVSSGRRRGGGRTGRG